ncbi:hypothetical protein C6341_g24429 [Phytophthora cactorum]|nr:hypothetical protein C6341_g24429 [Phytophthora cactorum]
MGASYGSSKYILVLKDHATHYCKLVVADTADSRVTTEALLAWYSRFGIPPVWVSDNGTHFKNEGVTELSRRLRTKQTFTPAYSPWIIGSVERVNRDILQVIKAMIISYKVSQKDWVSLVPLVQTNLNHIAVPSLGNRSPLEIFTGLQNPTPLQKFYLPEAKNLQQVPKSGEIDGYLANLRESVQSMHCAVDDKRLKQRLLNKKRERGENLVNFTVGDYVLRSRVDEKQSKKLQVTWVGPYRVLLTDELFEHISAQGIVLAVDKLKDHQWNNNIKDYEMKGPKSSGRSWSKAEDSLGNRLLLQLMVQSVHPGMTRGRHGADKLVGNDVELPMNMASSRETKTSTTEIR